MAEPPIAVSVRYPLENLVHLDVLLRPVLVPQGRTHLASDFSPWTGRCHGLKPEAILAHPLRGEEVAGRRSDSSPRLSSRTAESGSRET